MGIKKQKSRWNRLPIPEETMNSLMDWDFPMIKRVELAEKCRKEYGYSQADMLDITGISYTLYAGLCKVLKSGNCELCAKLMDGIISLRAALLELENPGYIEERGQYPFWNRIDRIANEIIYTDSRHILYRYEQDVFLGIAYNAYIEDESRWGYDEILCRLDDAPYAVDTTVALLQKGNTIYSDLTLHKRNQTNIGALPHHIMAAYSGISLNTIREAKVFFKRQQQGNVYDLRICNMRCRAVPRHISPEYTGGYGVMKCGDEIKIINHNTGAVITADYSEWLYGLLQHKKDYLKLQSRDDRLCVPICGSVEYLYHICVSVHLYGVPKDEEALGEMLGIFRVEYLSKKMQVDHLDNDCSNNRLSNLIVMTQSQHSKKQSLEASMKSLGLPYFCWVERYDDTALTVRAGIFDVLKSPVYRLHGVYSINEYLTAAEQFAHAAREECTVNKAFEEMENKEKKTA